MNKDQLLVLKHLKKNKVKATGILTVIKFSQDHFGAELPDEVAWAFSRMSEKEDFEVLEVFAKWGLEEADE